MNRHFFDGCLLIGIICLGGAALIGLVCAKWPDRPSPLSLSIRQTKKTTHTHTVSIVLLMRKKRGTPEESDGRNDFY